MTSFQFKRHWDCFLPHTHKITWNGYCSEETLSPSSECLLKMQTVNSFETLLSRPRYPNLHHIMFIHNCEKLKQKNPVDGSCRKNWITSTTLCSEPTLHDVMSLHFAPHLSYGFYWLVKWSNKVKGYNKTKNWMPFRNAKCYELYI